MQDGQLLFEGRCWTGQSCHWEMAART